MRRDVDDDDDHRILRDGERRRIPMMMRDEDSLSPLQRAIMQDAHETGRDRILSDAMDARTQVVDAFGNGGLALQRPGARYLSIPEHTVDSAVAEAEDYNRAQSYAIADAEARYSWKGGPQPGDECTIDGEAGTLVKEGNELVCRPHGHRDAQSVRDELERTFREREQADADPWRGPPDSGKWW